MKLIVDRIEGNFAVCETEMRNMVDLSLDILPHNIKEGNVLDIEGHNIKLDKQAEYTIKKVAQGLLDDLF